MSIWIEKTVDRLPLSNCERVKSGMPDYWPRVLVKGWSGRHYLLMFVIAVLGVLVNISNASEAEIQSALSTTTQQKSISAKYGWVVLGPNGAVARSVTTDGSFDDCPSINLHNQKASVTMKSRVSKQIGMPTAFTDITVCEYPIPNNIRTVTIAGQKTISLASLHNSLTDVVVLGDTGCRGSQHCDNPRSTWQFPAIAEAAAKESAELLLHVGDYHYREGFSQTGCKLQVQYGDCWLSWELDFFKVASEKKLLSKAPWIFARGNHETCKTEENRKSRAWRGWFLLLDPRPLDEIIEPPKPGNFPIPGYDLWAGKNSHTCKAYTSPYEVKLKDRGVWVIDSSGISSRDRGDNHSDFKPQFDFINRSITGPSWILLHHPVWGTSSHGWLTRSLAQAWDAAKSEELEAHVEMIFAGHIHLFEKITLKGLPTQFIFGGSGTSRDRTPLFPGQLGFSRYFTASVQSFAYTRDFDFGVISEDDDGSNWNIAVKNTATKRLNTCASQVKPKPFGPCSFQVKRHKQRATSQAPIVTK